MEAYGAGPPHRFLRFLFMHFVHLAQSDWTLRLGEPAHLLHIE